MFQMVLKSSILDEEFSFLGMELTFLGVVLTFFDDERTISAALLPFSK